MEPLSFFDGFLPVFGFATDLKIRFGCKQLNESFPNMNVVVRNQDGIRRVMCSHNCQVTTTGN
jgi:hypothetical protein